MRGPAGHLPNEGFDPAFLHQSRHRALLRRPWTGGRRLWSERVEDLPRLDLAGHTFFAPELKTAYESAKKRDNLVDIPGKGYYDEDGELARSMQFSEYENIGGRMMPRLMDMRPADKPDERTTMRYGEMAFDVDIDESFFSLRRLQSRR